MAMVLPLRTGLLGVRVMREATLYAPIKAWLEGQGYRVAAEVPILNRAIDVAAHREEDDSTLGIEMKVCLTETVIRQGLTLQLCCDLAYVAVGSKPLAASVKKATDHGLGVLQVKDDGVIVIAKPSGKRIVMDHYRDQLKVKVKHMPTDTVGGVPCLDGVGPARDCKRRVKEYRKKNPKSTWADVYENVPNHYASAKSMAGALGYSMRQRDYLKKLRRENRELGRQ